jgi:hypothetical protein
MRREKMKYVINDNAQRIDAYDERWYSIQVCKPCDVSKRPTKEELGIGHVPDYWIHYEVDGSINVDFPSVTTYIGDVWPKGYAFSLWQQRSKDPEMEREEAAQRGSRIHKGIEQLLTGETVSYNMDYPIDEWQRLMAWKAWWDQYNEDHKVEIVSVEKTVYSIEDMCGGTIDLLANVDGKLKIFDWKSGKTVGDTAEIQLSQYHRMANAESNPVIIQLLPGINKKDYKVIEIEDLEKLQEDFIYCRKIWMRINKKSMPKFRSYPMEIKL